MHKIEKRRAAAILAVVATVALTIVAGALADRGEPQTKITPADQARAVAMLPRRADFRQWDGATARPTPPASPVYCKSNDQSDLTLILGDSRVAVQLVFDDPLNVGNPDVRDAEVDLARIIAPRMTRVMGGG
jgi:hypothetical protein